MAITVQALGPRAVEVWKQNPLEFSWVGYSALTRATRVRVPVAEFWSHGRRNIMFHGEVVGLGSGPVKLPYLPIGVVVIIKYQVNRPRYCRVSDIVGLHVCKCIQ